MPFAHHLLYRSEIFFLISGVITFLYCCAISQNWILVLRLLPFLASCLKQSGFSTQKNIPPLIWNIICYKHQPSVVHNHRERMTFCQEHRVSKNASFGKFIYLRLLNQSIEFVYSGLKLFWNFGVLRHL